MITMYSIIFAVNDLEKASRDIAGITERDAGIESSK